MAAGTQVDGDLDIDVASLFGSLWRSKFKILGTALVLTGLVGAGLFFVSPKYRAETRIFIEQSESTYTRPQGATPEDLRANFDPEGVLSQVQLLTSADVLSAVLADETLAKSEEIQALDDLSWLESMMTLINRGAESTGTDRAIVKLREQLNIYRVENSRVIVIEYSSTDPLLAAAVPDAIARAYLGIQSTVKQNRDGTAIKILKSGIDKLEASLPQAEGAVAQYRAENDILIGQNNAALATQQLSELSSELTRVRSAKANATAKAENVRAQIESGASIDSIPEVLSSGLMQRLRESEVQLKSQIADLSTTLLPGHPQIKGLRSQLDDLNGQIRNEVQKVLRSLQTEAQTASIREKELLNQLNGLKAESSRVGEDEVELRRLEREVSTQRAQLASYRERYSEAVDRQSPEVQTADARIVQGAKIPSDAYFPKLVPSVLAAFIGSLLILSVIKLLSELFSGRAFRAAAVPSFAPQASASAPVIAAAEPVLRQDNEDVLREGSLIEAKEPQDGVNAEMSIAAVAARLINEGETCAMIVSPEGNNACASSVLIARELSDQGLRVVLLDLTGNSAAARPMLDGLALPGITNLLTGEATIAGIIHTDSYSDASVIPTGTADSAKAAKAVARLPMIISSLSSAFDMVIVECGTASAAGIKRLVLPGSGLLVSFIDAESKAIVSSLTELIAAGYEDLSLVTPVGSIGKEPVPGRSAA
ncbi:MAG: GumC family protein [Rhizobiaceae bacterium]